MPAPTLPANPTATATITPRPSITPTSSQTPMIMCTPPWCWEDEALHCPGQCPGGCGYRCATRTPDPLSTPTPTFPPPGSICAYPTPGPNQAEPRLAMCASRLEARVGETIELAVELIGDAQPDRIEIIGRDIDGTGNFSIQTRTGDHLPLPWSNSAHLNLALIQTHANQIFLKLQAQSPGAVEVKLRLIPTVPDVQAAITLTVLP